MTTTEPPSEPLTNAQRLQILAAEQASLVSTRALAWNESFSRTSMFLSTLSFGGVALALVAQATHFDENFRLFALAVLPVILFLGISTLLRLDSSNYHDALCVIGLNRIRAQYVRLAPDLAPVFVMGTSDDAQGVVRTMATLPGRALVVNLLAASPVVVAVLDGVLVGAILAILVIQLGGPVGLAIPLAIGGLVLFIGLVEWSVSRAVHRFLHEHVPTYPEAPAKSPPGGSLA